MASQLRRDYFWNTAAGIMLAAQTVIMLLVVTRVAGIWAGGVFALATAVGQQFQSLGMYEVRPYQATDVTQHFTFGTYHATRIITTTLMVIGIVGYPMASGRSGAELAAIIAVASIRILDAFEDVFFSEFQRVGRLDVGGRISFVRVFMTTAIFSVAIVMTRDLLVSSLVTIGLSVVLMVALIVPAARPLFDLKPRFDREPIGRLLRACFPLFLASFLALYLSNAPRFAIESFMDSEHQGYFSILFMPAFTINLLSTLIFRPLLTRMAVEWASDNLDGFTRLIMRGLQGAFLAFVATFAAAFLIGVPLLNLLYGVDVGQYKNEMLILVAGGAFNAVSTILYYALATMRHQNAVFIGYGVAAVLVLGLSTFAVSRIGIMGAALSYVSAMLMLALIFFVAVRVFLKKASS